MLFGRQKMALKTHWRHWKKKITKPKNYKNVLPCFWSRSPTVPWGKPGKLLGSFSSLLGYPSPSFSSYYPRYTLGYPYL